jgi:predicted nucleic acid-binding Zn ribbon protein
VSSVPYVEMPREVQAHRQERTCIYCLRTMQVMSDRAYTMHPECQKLHDAANGYAEAK